MELMRHSTAEMTLATYAHTVGDKKESLKESGSSCFGQEGECNLVDLFWTHATFSLIGPEFLG
jgi:hypothetical protein